MDTNIKLLDVVVADRIGGVSRFVSLTSATSLRKRFSRRSTRPSAVRNPFAASW